MEVTEIERIARNLQLLIEDIFYPKYPSGTCFWFGNILHLYYSSLGQDSQSVTGDLVLKDKSRKYAVYGTYQINRGTRFGEYHTWCQVNLDDRIMIVDPSMKYNKVALKNLYGFKVDPRIPDLLLTDIPKAHLWKYRPNDRLLTNSQSLFNNIPKKDIEEILQKLRTNHIPEERNIAWSKPKFKF